MLQSIGVILDGFDPAMVGAGERLGCARQARRLASRLTAVAGLLLADAEAARETMRAAGTPTTTWLAIDSDLSKREAGAALHQARELSQHPQVGQAAAAGRISVGQARAIHSVLQGLDGLDGAQQAKAEQAMLRLASSMDSDRLAKAAPLVLAEVAAGRAADTQERRLQRQAEAGRRNRSLVFGRDHNRSVTFTGSLPLADGEAWQAILTSYSETTRRNAHETRDPLAVELTLAQRTADALLAMTSTTTTAGRPPGWLGTGPGWWSPSTTTSCGPARPGRG